MRSYGSTKHSCTESLELCDIIAYSALAFLSRSCSKKIRTQFECVAIRQDDIDWYWCESGDNWCESGSCFGHTQAKLSALKLQMYFPYCFRCLHDGAVCTNAATPENGMRREHHWTLAIRGNVSDHPNPLGLVTLQTF